MKLSPEGKTNSLEEFIPLREKVVEKPTPLWGRFISPRENDAGRFRECSSRKRVFSLRGKFTPLNGKVVGKVNYLRKKAGERHVYPLRPMFRKDGPISLRYIMKFTRENFTSLRNLARERHVSLAIPVFLKGGPISPRYRMKFTGDNFTSLRGRFFSSKEKIANNFTSLRNLAGERHVSPAIPVFLRGPSSLREEAAKKEKHVRCIVPHVVSLG